MEWNGMANDITLHRSVYEKGIRINKKKRKNNVLSTKKPERDNKWNLQNESYHAKMRNNGKWKEAGFYLHRAVTVFFFSFCFRFLSFYFGRIVWLEPNTHLVEFDAGGSKVKLNYGWNGELRESLVRYVGSVQVRSATFRSLLRPNSNKLLTGLFLSTLFFHFSFL